MVSDACHTAVTAGCVKPDAESDMGSGGRLSSADGMLMRSANTLTANKRLHERELEMAGFS